MPSSTSCAPNSLGSLGQQANTSRGVKSVVSDKHAVEVVTFFMSEEEKMEHLLDAMPFMRTEDLSGYKKHFLPDAPSSKPVKRRRGSPGQCLAPSSLPDCANPAGTCGSGTLMEDVNEGSVVCLACGLIQSLSILESASMFASPSFHSGVSSIVVHHYSRIVHWVENIASLQGETKPKMTMEQEVALDTFCRNEESRIGGGVFLIREALRRDVIPYRFLRHANTIAFARWPTKVKLPSLSAKDVRAVLLQLRRYEDAWHREILGNSSIKRRNFPPFRFMWPVIIDDLGLDPSMRTLVEPLKVKACIKKLQFIVDLMRKRIALEAESLVRK